MRELTPAEIKTLTEFSSGNITYALLQVTDTGLRKSILDATESVRSMLAAVQIHDYKRQLQGQAEKVILPISFFTVNDLDQEIPTSISLYRPETKLGDPRLWIYGLRKYCNADDIVIIGHSHEIGFLACNLTQATSEKLLTGNNRLSRYLRTSEKSRESAIGSALEKLVQISAKGYIASPFKGDTSVGRLLEMEFGISANNSRGPDYLGIELKSQRKSAAARKARNQLFSCVPDWHLSHFSDRTEFLLASGYELPDTFKKLYCTVNSRKPNPQGLQLVLDRTTSILTETLEDIEGLRIPALRWELSKLHSRLAEKHAETLWVKADSLVKNGIEYFHFTEAEYTFDPILDQFDTLLERGEVSLDHTLKLMVQGGTTQDKGWNFKIASRSRNSLFSPSRFYDLTKV